MPKELKRNIAIYSRKSRFTGKGESIENQIEMCQQYIKQNIAADAFDSVVVYEDEGYSGKNTERPQFQALLQAIHSNQIDAVVCYRLDRISRNIGDFAHLMADLDRYDVKFHSLKEKFDTSTPTGRAMIMIASVFSQLERETIAERIRDNMVQLAKTGRWLGGVAPTGYQSVPVDTITIDDKKRRSYKLDLVKEEAALIELIFGKFLETKSLTKTETFFEQNHSKTKNGKRITRFAIKSILQNPVYLTADVKALSYFQAKQMEIYADDKDFDGKHGMMVYNKTVQSTGKSHEERPAVEWIVAVGKHTPMISSSDWIAAQKLLDQNKSKSYRKPKSNVALLSGLLFCARCGDFLRPKLTTRANKDGELVYSYLCETKEKSRCQNCDIKNPNGNQLDKLVCEEIKKLSFDSSTFIQQLEQAKKTILGDTSDYDNQLTALRKDIKETEKQIDTLVTTLSKTDNDAVSTRILAEIEQLQQQNRDTTQHLTELESLTKEHELSDIEFDLLRDLLSTFAGALETMSVEEKRSALRTFIRKVIWDGENAHVYLFGSQEGDIELPELQAIGATAQQVENEPQREGCK